VTTLVVLPKKFSNGVLMYDDKGFLWSFQTLQWMEKQRYVAGGACQMSKFSGPKTIAGCGLNSISLQSLFLNCKKFLRRLEKTHSFSGKARRGGRFQDGSNVYDLFANTMEALLR
jgi:hypothetical protein